MSHAQGSTCPVVSVVLASESNTNWNDFVGFSVTIKKWQLLQKIESLVTARATPEYGLNDGESLQVWVRSLLGKSKPYNQVHPCTTIWLKSKCTGARANHHQNLVSLIKSYHHPIPVPSIFQSFHVEHPIQLCTIHHPQSCCNFPHLDPVIHPIPMERSNPTYTIHIPKSFWVNCASNPPSGCHPSSWPTRQECSFCSSRRFNFQRCTNCTPAGVANKVLKVEGHIYKLAKMAQKQTNVGILFRNPPGRGLHIPAGIRPIPEVAVLEPAGHGWPALKYLEMSILKLKSETLHISIECFTAN